MHPDEESQTTLSKWPFIIGDVLLVASALAIAVLGQWQLTNWQVFACVAAVALGAALFVLPYVVEFQVRVREEREDRSADLRILGKQINSLGQELVVMEERMRALEAVSTDAGQPDAVLAEVIDQKFARLEASRSVQEEAIQELQANLKEASGEKGDGLDSEILKSVGQRLDALEAKRSAESASDDAGPAEKSAQTPTSLPEKPKKTVGQVERPVRSARQRHGPEESGLLQRAITEKGDHSSTAVSRIIGTKTKLVPADSPDVDEPATERNADQGTTQAVDDKPESAPKQAAKKAKAKPAAPEGAKAPARTKKPRKEKPAPTAGSREEAAVEPERLEGTAPEAPVADDTKVSDAPEQAGKEAAPAESPAEPDEADAAEAPAASSGMLFDEDKITSPVVRTKARKNDAVVTASVFIGIGNKPYLRGSGGGLSWEKGVLMEFQEIGKWRWVAPSDLDGAVEVQIYCNDEAPDKSGKYTIEPGEKKVLKPVF